VGTLTYTIDEGSNMARLMRSVRNRLVGIIRPYRWYEFDGACLEDLESYGRPRKARFTNRCSLLGADFDSQGRAIFPRGRAGGICRQSLMRVSPGQRPARRCLGTRLIYSQRRPNHPSR
jgi:hypothetical protein